MLFTKGHPKLGSEDCRHYMGIGAPCCCQSSQFWGRNKQDRFLYELSQFLNRANSFFKNYAGQTQYNCGQDSNHGTIILSFFFFK